jgi:hypothetical protein
MTATDGVGSVIAFARRTDHDRGLNYAVAFRKLSCTTKLVSKLYLWIP